MGSFGKNSCNAWAVLLEMNSYLFYLRPMSLDNPEKDWDIDVPTDEVPKREGPGKAPRTSRGVRKSELHADDLRIFDLDAWLKSTGRRL